MAKIKRYAAANNQLAFMCPGCNQRHWINDKETEPKSGPVWEFNGNYEFPTVIASVLVRWPANPNATEEFKEWRKERICHSFITDGNIQFLSDCTHKFAGKTVELQDIDQI